MTGRPHDPDEALEGELRALLPRVDAPPAHLADDARRARTTVMPIESCLLEIAYDSVLDVTLGHFDPQESVRLLSFGGDGLRLDLRLEPEGSGVTIAGWSAPRRADSLSLESERAFTSLSVRSDGTFTVHGIERRRIRLHVTATFAGGSRRFHTSWFKS